MKRPEDFEIGRLRAAFARARRHSQERPDGCPESSLIWDAATGALVQDEIAEIVDHTIGCGSCAEDWRLARTVAIESGLLKQEAPAPTAGPLPFKRWHLPLAAAAVLMIVSSVLYIRHGSAPVYREPTSSRVLESLIEDGAALPRSRLVLRWAEPAPGSRYEVRVTTIDLTMLVRKRNLTEPEFLVPVEALESVPPGGTVAWQIDAILPDGGRATSPTYLVRIE